MKTKLCNALIVLFVHYFFSIKAFSQEVYSNTPSSEFYFTVGITASNLINDTNAYKVGVLFNGGFVYSINVSDKLNASIECLYTGKGFKQDSPVIKYRYFYVDVPLYMQLKLNESIRVNMGVQYSLFTNSNVVYIDGSKQNGVKITKYNSIKNNDYSFLLGAEININKSLVMAGRYTISGSTFFEKSGINFGVFQLSFNYTAFRSYKQLFHKNKKTIAE